MERTRKTTSPADDRIRWKKIGGGSARLTIDGVKRLIPPGQIFRASPRNIPESFRDVIIPLDSFVKVEEHVIESVKTIYNVVPRGKSKSLFDVVDKQGKKMNESVLSKETAEKFKRDLER